MSFASGYRGSKGGAVQSIYTDQPGIAIAGMIAFASDLTLIDAIFIAEVLGLRAGAGVKLVQLDESAYNFQAPNQGAFLPADAGETIANFGGIVVFDETMQSDENGVPGYEKGRVGRILRPKRGGGRIWVRVKDAVTPDVSGVHWCIDAVGNYVEGDFSPAALGGGGSDSVDISTIARWVTKAAAGELAMLEIF